jgi:hypothetical protein
MIWVVVPCGFIGRYQHFGETTVSISRAEDGDCFSETSVSMIPYGITTKKNNTVRKSQNLPTHPILYIILTYICQNIKLSTSLQTCNIQSQASFRPGTCTMQSMWIVFIALRIKLNVQLMETTL